MKQTTGVRIRTTSLSASLRLNGKFAPSMRKRLISQSMHALMHSFLKKVFTKYSSLVRGSLLELAMLFNQVETKILSLAFIVPKIAYMPSPVNLHIS